jgi:hypothetical protein
MYFEYDKKKRSVKHTSSMHLPHPLPLWAALLKRCSVRRAVAQRSHLIRCTVTC